MLRETRLCMFDIYMKERYEISIKNYLAAFHAACGFTPLLSDDDDKIMTSFYEMFADRKALPIITDILSGYLGMTLKDQVDNEAFVNKEGTQDFSNMLSAYIGMKQSNQVDNKSLNVRQYSGMDPHAV